MSSAAEGSPIRHFSASSSISSSSLVPAVIAAGALIAFADGAVEPRELEEIDDEALKCLMGDPSAAEDIHRVVGLHMSNFDRDHEYGHDRALAVLADFASDAPDDQKITVLTPPCISPEPAMTAT